MQCYARKSDVGRVTSLGNGLNRTDEMLHPSYSARNRLLVTGKNVQWVLRSLRHRLSLNNLSRTTPLPLSLMKPMRLQAHCSCQPSVVNVRRDYTTIYDRTHNLIYSSLQLHRYDPLLGIFIPYSSTSDDISTSKSGETNTST